MTNVVEITTTTRAVWLRGIAFSVCMLFALAVFSAAVCSPASAAISHSLLSSFGGDETPSGSFGLITSIAVDNSTGPSKGDVYVYETSLSTEVGAVDKFEADGKYAGVQITGAETPQGFLFPLAQLTNGQFATVTVDDSSGPNSGDVYVTDTENRVVDRFDESGHYICQITGSETPSVSECNGASGSDTPNKSFRPTGVAVDSHGNVYIADAQHEVVDRFNPSGGYVGQIINSEIARLSSLALDSNDNLYAINFKDNVVKFDAGGSFVSILDETEPTSENNPTSVATDQSDDHVYVADTTPHSEIAEYDSTGKLLDTFGEGLFDQANGLSEKVLGLAASSSTGDVYAAEELLAPGAKVDVFGPDLMLPAVTTDAATSVEQTTATLNGVTDPEIAEGGAEVTGCKFEYGTSTSYGQVASCEPSPPYSAATDVSTTIDGLTPDTTYHFSLAATTTNGTGHGADRTFTTAGAPTVDSESSSSVVVSTATVSTQINPFGLDTKCQVQYVDEEVFASSGYDDATTVPCDKEDLGSGFGDQDAEATLDGLRIDTVYHFRFLASNSAAPSGVGGADQTFATFGVKSFSFEALTQGLEPYTQAGGHPYQLITKIKLNTTTVSFLKAEVKEGAADANPKDAVVELPPGLVGNPEATPKCLPYNAAHADCSGATQVGILKVFTAGNQEHESPIYNLVPPTGMAAQFGARFNGFVTAHIDGKVRTGGDYGITADSLYLSAAEGLSGAEVTFWGVPSDPSHDKERYCPVANKVNEEIASRVNGEIVAGECHEHGAPIPFLTNSTSCSSPQRTVLHTDSWQDPGVFVEASSEMPAVIGCEKLDFKPTISATPTSQNTDSPTGLKVGLEIPQNEDPTGLAEAQLKDVHITLPQGVTINPSAANGLQACSAAQIAMSSPDPATCPAGSQIGVVHAVSPLVDHPLEGAVYVAAQHENPFGSLYAIYIAIDDPQTGVVVKVAGEVTADHATGQLTTTFNENPQLPFEKLEVNLFGGERAALATPTQCGAYTTAVSLTPWSAPQSGAPMELFPSFQLTSGPGSSPCSTLGFAPSLIAGTIGNEAGAFSPFTLTLSRNDGEQRFGQVSVQMPPGLEGILAGIPRCPEAQANTGNCPIASKIGQVTVTAGTGNDPVILPEAGKPQDPVYLTDSYNGAPFGLSIVVPAEAGPFNLDENGQPIVVRAKIEVDPHTAQVTVISNPVPTILQGVPTDVRSINVSIDREHFTFNPTNCHTLAVAGTINSTQGATANPTSRFQAADCTTLPYKPTFTGSSSPKFSRTNGISLNLKIKPIKGQANTSKVRLVFPKQLPTRLSTLKLACPSTVFNTNPSNCPTDSRVGNAIAHTPVLASPLSGPIYLVSYGGAAFPDAEIVLQGENVELIMDGKTNIQKGITSSTFETVPDAPFNTFEAHLPAGPHSAFAAVIKNKRNGSLCGQNLNIGNILIGQNGTELKHTTKITINNCPNTKKHKKK